MENPRPSRSSELGWHCCYITQYGITERVNDIDSDEFEITDRHERINDSTHTK
jgi:hypothetical protein